MMERLKLSADHARNVLISVNPKAGKKDSHDKATELAQLLTSAGFEAEIITELTALDDRVKQATDQGTLRTVVGIGGDGTASLIAGRFQSKFQERVPLTILPAGTENLLAKYLKLDDRPESTAKVIADGFRVQLDAGKANGQVFLVMASCGFDADVVNRLHRKRKGHIGHLAYAEPIIGALGNYRYPKLSIRYDDHKPVSARWAFVFNIPKYAMQLPIVEDACPTDGKLDLCTFRAGNILNGVRYLFGILTRQHRKWQDTNIARVQKIRIESSSDEVAFQIDGDPGGYLPLEIEVLPGFLDILVSRNWLTANGFELNEKEIGVV